jgi:hypothetical protein
MRTRNEPPWSIAGLLAIACLAGCTSWRVQSVSPEMVVSGQHPEAVLVTRTDSSRLVVQSPSIVADTLRGQVDGQPLAVPMADVAAIAVRRSDGGKTAGLILGSGVAALLGLAALIAATW